MNNTRYKVVLAGSPKPKYLKNIKLIKEYGNVVADMADEKTPTHWVKDRDWETC